MYLGICIGSVPLVLVLNLHSWLASDYAVASQSLSVAAMVAARCVSVVQGFTCYYVFFSLEEPLTLLSVTKNECKCIFFYVSSLVLDAAQSFSYGSFTHKNLYQDDRYKLIVVMRDEAAKD